MTSSLSRQRIQASSPAAPWRWAGLGGVLGLLLATLLFAPAAWLSYAVSQASQGRVVLNDAQGSVWQGSAQLVLSGGAGSRDAMMLPGRVNWHLQAVLPFNLQLQLAADCCTTQAFELLLTPHLTGVTATMQANQSSWPATLLTGLGAPFNTIDLQAQLKLNSQAMTFSLLDQQFKFEGQADLDVLDASTRLSTLRPVGSYRVSMLGGTIPTFKVQTLSGSLQLTGDGEFKGQRWRFKGEATAAAGSEAALNNFLDILGRRVGPRSLITL